MIARLALVLLLLVGACGGDGATAATEYERFRTQGTACGGTRPEAAATMSFAAPGDGGVSSNARATLHTSCGDIVIELRHDLAPATVNSFVFLAAQGYFDGTVSHRIVPGFVVQLGDPTATGRGGPGYQIPDEFPPTDFAYTAGVVAMANGGAGTGGSQFFIAFNDIALDPDYSVFGYVIAGTEVLERIAEIPVTTNPATLEPSLPLQTMYLESITIEP